MDPCHLWKFLTYTWNIILLGQLYSCVPSRERRQNVLKKGRLEAWMVLTALVIGAAAVIGTLGNILIILAVCLVKPLRTCGNVFVVNLSLADLVVTAFIDPFNVVGAVAGRNVLIYDRSLCDWVASFCAPACMSSMWNMCAISLNRYVLICKPHLYHKIYTFPSSIMCCASIWIMAHLFHLPNHLGWGETRFNAEYYLCTFDIFTHSYAIFYIVMGVLIPLVGVLYGYTAIFLKVRSVKSQLRNHQEAVLAAASTKAIAQKSVGDRPPLTREATADSASQAPKIHRPKRPEFTQDDVKLAKTLFAAFLVFLICWLPFALFVLAHEPEQIPSELYVIAIIMAHGNSAVNPILYGMTNEKFRDGYRNVLGLSKRSATVTTQGKMTKGYMATENFTTHSGTHSGSAGESSRTARGPKTGSDSDIEMGVVDK